MPLQGSLREMSLANLIQVNCQEMRSARLTLSSKGEAGEIFLSDGQVVHAALGSHVGEEAVYEMIQWDEGSFVLDLDLVSPQKSITLGWQDLLLRGMMQVPARQPAEKQPEEKMNPDVLAQLRAIDGVSGAVISASDGMVLAASVPDSDGEHEAAVAVFIGSAADQLGQALQLDTFAHGTVSLKSKRILVLEEPDRYIGLVLGENASAAIVAGAASQVLKKQA
jgi:predicted regulator of Ras-like GTPase activity (Roadblock/LC7/MglB family)